jgi:formate/nitrite transporter FocA (FNT family)
MKKSLFEGIAAGVYIGIGGAVFLACENKVLGAVFFTVALLSICLTGMQLFTGKVGMIVTSHTRADVVSLFGCLLGNLLGTLLCALIARVGVPTLRERSAEVASVKLNILTISTGPLRVLFAGILCGILMYTAVWAYKQKNTVWGILFCVPVFILAGFEHSIADMFYLFFAGTFDPAGFVTPAAFLFLLLVVIGNSVGGMLIPFLALLGKEKEKEADQ